MISALRLTEENQDRGTLYSFWTMKSFIAELIKVAYIGYMEKNKATDNKSLHSRYYKFV